MDDFAYRDGELFAEQVSLRSIAEHFGTPCYVYSRATLERQYAAFDQAYGDIDHEICYSVKANGNLGVLDVLARMGAGFDIVSVGELERVLAAGGSAGKTIFSGVGKTPRELRRALEAGVAGFNVESEGELEALAEAARVTKRIAPISFRVNPDVDPKTHPYIATGLKESKFGVPFSQAKRLYRIAAECPHLKVEGVDCHIGSQVITLEPFAEAVTRVLDLVGELADEGIGLKVLNLGGGLGIRYRDEQPPEPAAYAAVISPMVRDRGLKLRLEPGRSIAGNAGVLLTRVHYVKSNESKHFAVVDAAMNDLIRPALYGGWHEIVPVRKNPSLGYKVYDVVGPVCESADFLGKQRSLAIEPEDLLAIRSAGAYGFAMSSNYNTRPRAAEVMVDGAHTHLVRVREEVHELFAKESRLP